MFAFGMRIEQGKIRWPKHLAQIDPDGDKRVIDSPAERPALAGFEGLLLSKPSGDGHGRCKNKHRDLLNQEPTRRGERNGVERLCLLVPGWKPGKPLQRPVIQKQKNKRQRDQHRLGKKSKSESSQGPSE